MHSRELIGFFANKHCEQLIRQRVSIKNGCWIWIGYKSISGYGTIRHQNKNIRAHRMSYAVFVGDVPAGKIVCHKCDTPACVKPDHLFLGTQQDNANDQVQKNRHLFGVKNPNCKLKESDVFEILSSLKLGLRYKKIAQRFGVSVGSIERIAANDGWKHIKRDTIKRTPTAKAMRGVENPSAKLDFEKAKKINTMLSNGISQQKIAKKFGVSQVTISRVFLKKSWFKDSD